MNTQILIPSQLLVGQEENLIKETELLLQKHFCLHKNKSNFDVIQCYCLQCKQIKNRQHPFIIWIDTKKEYTLDDINIIFEKTLLSLETNYKFFFIIQKANRLSKICANKLLKILEEPPTGYNFILLTNNENNILPTIRSRCFIKHFKSNTEDTIFFHPLVTFFIKNNFNLFEFEKELGKSKLSPSENIELLNQLFISFHKQAIDKNINEQQRQIIMQKINFLKKVMKKPASQGSTKIFWKNIYMQFLYKWSQD